MKKSFSFLFLLAFLLSFLQSFLITFNFVLLLILSSALVLKGEKTAWLAFFAGLVLDLFLGQPLGLSSFLFLVFSLVIYFAGRRLLSLGRGALFLLAFMAELMFNYLHFHRFVFSRALILALFFVGLFSLLLKREVKGEPSLKLEVE